MTERKDDRRDLPRDLPVTDGLSGGGDTLDSLFAAARAEVPLPVGDFLSRMEALALAEQPAVRDAPPVASIEPQGSGFVRQLREALGGWAGIAGLVTACVAGVWIGISPPDSLTVFWGGDAGMGALGVDPLGSFDLPLMEG